MALSDREIKQLLEKAGLFRGVKGEDLPYLEQALDCYNQIIKNVSSHPHYFSERAEVKYRLCHRLSRDDLLDSAIEDINKAIELEPDKGYHYYKRGYFLWYKLLEKQNICDSEKNNQPWEVVIADYKSSLSRDPTYSHTWLNLIGINIILYNWDDAISLYGQCKPYINTKENQLFRSYLGCLAFIFAGDPIKEEDKEPLYDQAIRLNDLCSCLERRISSFIDKIHGKEDYKEKWDKAIEITRLYISHYEDPCNRGEMLKDLKFYEEALRAYDKAIERDFNYILAWVNKAWILGQLGRYEEALKASEKVIELKPDYAVAWDNKGWNLGQLNRHEEALKAYERAIELNPNRARLWTEKGRALGQLKRYEEALKVIDKAIELNPDDALAWTWNNKGWHLGKLKRYEEALKALDKAIELNPDDARVWRDKGWILGKLGRHEEADKAYDKAMQLEKK